MSEGRVALVTGAGGGLGSSVARKLLEAGDRVVLLDRKPDGQCEALAAPHGDRARVIRGDLRNTALCDRLVANTAADWGRLDALVNCAAILHRLEIAEVTEKSFADVLNVNLRSVFWLCRAALGPMENQGGGRIVNVTSVGLHTGGYSLTSAVYEASKGAVANLTKTLARYGASRGILVNSVAPGAMRTPMLTAETAPELLTEIERDIPMRRMADPAEVAEVVVFLASARNTYVTGASVDANGGVAMA